MLILQERYVVCSVHGVCSPEDLLRGEVNEPGRENAFLRGGCNDLNSRSNVESDFPRYSFVL